MNLALTALFIGLPLFLALWLWRRFRRPRPVAGNLLGIDLPLEPPPFSHLTPRGARVDSYMRLRFPAEVLAAVDDGIGRFLESTEPYGWKAYRTYEEVNLVMIPPTAVTIDGFPALYMRDHSKISGVAIGVDILILPKPERFIVGPAVDTSDPATLGYLAAIVRHELEHLSDKENLSEEQFRENARPGHIHPLYGGPAPLVDTRQSAMPCQVCLNA